MSSCPSIFCQQHQVFCLSFQYHLLSYTLLLGPHLHFLQSFFKCEVL
ncbi:hypothetical protein E2C01_081884 [Portunus trituberculatus]|uniref:Uncharacterized protein n=1 Tax=Portunus trituberculatus TaxID=210409 RepID=A0A5B7IZA9_PORTR|nr:hypothetical protein [Portunus trituberculatus]